MLNKFLISSLLSSFIFLIVFAFSSFALEYEDYAYANLRALNKITAKTSLLKLKVGETQEFDKLLITLKSCKQTKPTEIPESAAFLEINEYLPQKLTSKEVFSGWLFASSPSLSAIEHPQIDLWLINCESKMDKQKKTETE